MNCKVRKTVGSDSVFLEPSLLLIRVSNIRNSDFVMPMEIKTHWTSSFNIFENGESIEKFSMSVLQVRDDWFPLEDDPLRIGEIACATVLSDLYAMGETNCGNIKMLMMTSSKMSEHVRDAIVPFIIRGFKNAASKAGIAKIDGETIIIDPRFTLGGIVSASGPKLLLDVAIAGDVLVLTKPLGTQVALTAYQWLLYEPDRWHSIEDIVKEEEVEAAYEQAMESMARLNRTAAELMHVYNAHSATDVTGLGLLGHAQKLASRQKNAVAFKIHILPVIANMGAVAEACGDPFKLLQGFSADISGGLLICLSRQNAVKYVRDIKAQEGCQAWEVGTVEKGNRGATLVSQPALKEVFAND